MKQLLLAALLSAGLPADADTAVLGALDACVGDQFEQRVEVRFIEWQYLQCRGDPAACPEPELNRRGLAEAVARRCALTAVMECRFVNDPNACFDELSSRFEDYALEVRGRLPDPEDSDAFEGLNRFSIQPTRNAIMEFDAGANWLLDVLPNPVMTFPDCYSYVLAIPDTMDGRIACEALAAKTRWLRIRGIEQRLEGAAD